MIGQPLITLLIARIICVLSSIDFDDEPTLTTHKVHNIRPDRLLAHEFCSRLGS
jgi:hypothetical protein